MTPVAEALNDMIWATLPMRNLLTGSSRSRFMEIWTKASKALCHDRFKVDETPVANPREAAIRLHRQCLDTCAALGVKPHDLVPHFNNAVDGGFLGRGDAADHVVLLGLEALRTARAIVAAREGEAA